MDKLHQISNKLKSKVNIISSGLDEIIKDSLKSSYKKDNLKLTSSLKDVTNTNLDKIPNSFEFLKQDNLNKSNIINQTNSANQSLIALSSINKLKSPTKPAQNLDIIIERKVYRESHKKSKKPESEMQVKSDKNILIVQDKDIFDQVGNKAQMKSWKTKNNLSCCMIISPIKKNAKDDKQKILKEIKDVKENNTFNNLNDLKEVKLQNAPYSVIKSKTTNFKEDSNSSINQYDTNTSQKTKKFRNKKSKSKIGLIYSGKNSVEINSWDYDYSEYIDNVSINKDSKGKSSIVKCRKSKNSIEKEFIDKGSDTERISFNNNSLDLLADLIQRYSPMIKIINKANLKQFSSKTNDCKIKQMNSFDEPAIPKRLNTDDLNGNKEKKIMNQINNDSVIKLVKMNYTEEDSSFDSIEKEMKLGENEMEGESQNHNLEKDKISKVLGKSDNVINLIPCGEKDV